MLYPLSYTELLPWQDSNLRPPAYEAKYPLSSPPAKFSLLPSDCFRVGAGESSRRVRGRSSPVPDASGLRPRPEKPSASAGSAALLSHLARSNSSLSPPATFTSFLQTHVRSDVEDQFPTLSLWRTRVSAPQLVYGQGTGGNGRACALRTRTSQPAEAELLTREVSVANHHWP